MRASEGAQPSPRPLLGQSLNPWTLAGTIALCPRGEGQRQGVVGPTGSQGPGQECGVRRRRARTPKRSTYQRDLPAGPRRSAVAGTGRLPDPAGPAPARQAGDDEAPQRSGTGDRVGRLEECLVLCNPRRGQGAPPTDHVGHGNSKTI